LCGVDTTQGNNSFVLCLHKTISNDCQCFTQIKLDFAWECFCVVWTPHKEIIPLFCVFTKQFRMTVNALRK
jgi:hypothetical protein